MSRSWTEFRFTPDDEYCNNPGFIMRPTEREGRGAENCVSTVSQTVCGLCARDRISFGITDAELELAVTRCTFFLSTVDLIGSNDRTESDSRTIDNGINPFATFARHSTRSVRSEFNRETFLGK